MLCSDCCLFVRYRNYHVSNNNVYFRSLSLSLALLTQISHGYTNHCCAGSATDNHFSGIIRGVPSLLAVTVASLEAQGYIVHIIMIFFLCMVVYTKLHIFVLYIISSCYNILVPSVYNLWQLMSITYINTYVFSSDLLLLCYCHPNCMELYMSTAILQLCDDSLF